MTKLMVKLATPVNCIEHIFDELMDKNGLLACGWQILAVMRLVNITPSNILL